MRLYRNEIKLYKDGKLYNIIMKHKEPEGFTITYNIDSENSTTSTVKAGTPILNYTPSKSEYTFVGWREDSTASSTVLSGTTATTNMTLYAVFKKDITVSYNANGGTGSVSSQTGTIYYNNGNVKGATFTLKSNAFTYTDRTFQKWAMGSASGTQYAVGASVTVTDDTTFYAVWKATAVSSKKLYSGSGGVSQTIKTFDTTGYSSVTISLKATSIWAWMWLYKGTTAPGTYTTHTRSGYGDGVESDNTTTYSITLPANSGVQSFGYAVTPDNSYGGYDTNTSWEIRVTAS